MSRTLTTPDLVLLSLLSEQPMHGYQANQELARRCIRDWAAISRPQVYYSLTKLAKLALIRAAGDDADAAGPERTVFATTPKGLAALAAALDSESWATERERPPFLTWLALSWRSTPAGFARQLARRREFLEQQLTREEETMRGVLREVGHPYHEAVWMIALTLAQIRTELSWLKNVAKQAPHRARARSPEITSGSVPKSARRGSPR